MSALVLDCSVAVSWCFQDQADDFADHVLDEIGTKGAAVPTLWPLELANVLLIGERRRKISGRELARLLDFIGSLPIEVDEEAPHRAFDEILSFGRTRVISAYDACYLELASRLELPLATRDEGLRKAARAVGVELARK